MIKVEQKKTLGEVRSFKAGEFDVCVVGAGHAGCEAALATARMGHSTVMMTICLDGIALLACNPSIGGTAKGHLVREIDALGGEMGKVTDETMIQCKMLNKSKGPAVHSLRAQCDKYKYHETMKRAIEDEENLYLLQAETTAIERKEDGTFRCYTQYGSYYDVKSVIVTTGTFLKGKVFIGELNYESGPSGLFPSTHLSDSLRKLGVDLRRFKTGTPARISSDTIDYGKCAIQHGDEKIIPFSFMTDKIDIEQIPCYLTYTTKETKDIILRNLDRSPLFTGVIESVGPRYCPSIEDKVVKFEDKDRHQIFIEPEGLSTKEMYIQGMSSSLPFEVQQEMYKTMIGLENSEIMRPAYAIEYDCIYPTNLKASLEYKGIDNLFFAGQVNGSSGYEEAAGQGILAGINAALSLENRDPMILGREESYIGVLVDDLVIKGTDEPYRMMTSRAEYRLVLRQDNADLRLTEKGYKAGLVTKDRYNRFREKYETIDKEIERLRNVKITPKADTNEYLESIGAAALDKGMDLYTLLKRPEITYENTFSLDPERPDMEDYCIEYIQNEIKYEGYIKKQKRQIEQFKRLESKWIPEDIDYASIHGLRIEAQQKMKKISPKNIGQASRISGVSPADINVLIIYLEQFYKKDKNNNINDK